MNTPQRSAEYPTRDIYLATVLKQAGISIIRVENHSGRGIFIFKATPEIGEIISRYFNGELRTDPQSLFSEWKSLKSLAYSTIQDVK